MESRLQRVLQLCVQVSTLHIRQSHSLLLLFVFEVKSLYNDLFKNEPQQVPESEEAFNPPISTLLE